MSLVTCHLSLATLLKAYLNQQHKQTMTWLQRIKEGILTKTVEKKEAPDGIWTKCKECKKAVISREFIANYYICPLCDHHHRIGSQEYFELFFDKGSMEQLFDGIYAKDILEFTDLKPYHKRLVDTKEKTNLEDAMAVATGKCYQKNLVVAAMDFAFIGGSMGSVVGEKISLAVDYCMEHRTPLVIVSKSGGARMMEAAFSLMQMAKTAAKLSLLAKAKIPYISLMTNPTTGGVTASYAMLGDINMAEPKALIAFAGPRVIKETIKRDLPEGFQRSEFLLDKGFLDLIVHRKDLKEKMVEFLTYFEC